MSRKIFKFLNKYSVSVLVTIFLCSIFAIGLLYFNRKEASVDNTDNITTEKEYANKKYGFYLTLPSNIYAIEETLSNSLAVIYFVDQKRKDYQDIILKYGDDFAYNFSDSGKIFFVLRIISKNSSTEEDISVKNSTQDAEKNLERACNENFLEKTEYLIGQEKVTFYLATQKKPDYLDTTILNMKLPSADAFFEHKNDIYHFSLANTFSENQNEVMGRIEIMRQTIRSIKFDN